ncbi:MAG: NAD(P)H-dependent oxidoreductase, partial [Planctomycetaceae bacterium]
MRGATTWSISALAQSDRIIFLPLLPMPPIPSRVLLDQLNWRYATKKFDPSRKIAPADWAVLEQAVTLAPSSYGLQAWKFFVVDSPAVRQQLLAASWNQPQVVDASHLVVFAVRKSPNAGDVERYVERIAQVRRLPVDSLDGLKQSLLGAVGRPEADVDTWLSRQVYVALGVFLSAAALLGIDACPMEGFQGPRYDEILGLTARGYSARVIATAG